MAKHSRYSPSASPRWIPCPGSVPLSETVPKPPSSKYADEGNAAHLLVNYHLTDADTSMDFIPYGGSDWPVTDEMKEAVGVATDYINKAASQGGIFWSEERVHASSIHDDIHGTVDAAIWWEDIGMLEIVDFKYGKGIAVEAKGNSQMRIYAIGFVDSFIENWGDVEFVKCTIIQPRAPHHDGPIRSEMVSVATLNAFLVDCQAAIRLTKANKPVLKEGDWCRWCPVGLAGACPIRNQEAASMFQMITEDKMLETEADFYPNDLAEFQNMVSKLESWCKQISGATKQAIENGEDVPGWKVVNGRATRQWKEGSEAATYFKKILKTKAYAEPKLKTPAQMEKLISKEAVNEYCNTVSTTTALVPDSDKRQAIEFKPMFEALS